MEQNNTKAVIWQIVRANKIRLIIQKSFHTWIKHWFFLSNNTCKSRSSLPFPSALHVLINSLAFIIISVHLESKTKMRKEKLQGKTDSQQLYRIPTQLGLRSANAGRNKRVAPTTKTTLTLKPGSSQWGSEKAQCNNIIYISISLRPSQYTNMKGTNSIVRFRQLRIRIIRCQN